MPQQHEIRLALVMNGGVSLAVWMAGVAHELDLIRRATTAGTPLSRGDDVAVADRWRDLLTAPGAEDPRRLVIDVIAGTSAGGLNGCLLANVIAHDATLDPEVADQPAPGPWLRAQWCDLGTLRNGKLIPDPAEGPDPTGSILDGEFFYEEAKRLLTELQAANEPTNRHPVTLFTTASGLGKQEFVAHDAAGQPFTVSDHRFLYRFTNDHPPQYDPENLAYLPPPGSGGDFADVDRLALAARSSASFPVAFAPRHESELNDPQVRHRPRRETQPSWLMDGGVLDNAPFGPVLETVSAAPVSGHVSRYVMYVVPSSGIGQGATTVDVAGAEPPSWKQTAMSVVQFPREVDFRSDVEELEALRIEADTAWSDAQQAFGAARRDPAERARILEAAQHLQPIYTRGRAAGGVWEALVAAQAGHITALDDSAAAPARNVDEILSTGPRWTPAPGNAVELFVAGTGPGAGTAPRWPWGMGPAERVVRTLLRSVRAQTATAFRAPGGLAAAPLADLEGQLDTLTDVRRNLRAIRDAVGDGVAGSTAISPASEPDAVAHAINEVFDELRVQEALGQEVQRAVDTISDGEELARLALALEVVERCMSSRTPDQRSAPFKFVRLGPDVPLPLLSDEDQELATSLGDRIIYGTQVGHFGSFGAEGWRRWDWLMGRLHAVAHLGRLLHDADGDGARAEANAWIAETQRAVLHAEGLTPETFTARLQDLSTTFPPGPASNGVREMLRAMNDADADGEPSTRHLGDRLVHSAGGLPAGLGRWVKAAAGRRTPTPDPDSAGSRPGAADTFVRWFAEPARTSTWNALTGGRADLERSRGWPVVVLNPALWWTITALGVAFLIAAAVADTESDTAWISTAIAAVVLTLGVLGTIAVAVVRWGRSKVARWLSAKLGLGDSPAP